MALGKKGAWTCGAVASHPHKATVQRTYQMQTSSALELLGIFGVAVIHILFTTEHKGTYIGD